MGLTDMPDNFEPGLPQAVRQAKFYRASDFQANFYETVENRCFFRTDSGEMGLGPYHTKLGDVVVVLFGPAHLLILRPKELNYELVGDVYVYGGMYGKFLNDSIVSADRFTLC